MHVLYHLANNANVRTNGKSLLTQAEQDFKYIYREMFTFDIFLSSSFSFIIILPHNCYCVV